MTTTTTGHPLIELQGVTKEFTGACACLFAEHGYTVADIEYWSSEVSV